jgi:hypothetical protein
MIFAILTSQASDTGLVIDISLTQIVDWPCRPHMLTYAAIPLRLDVSLEDSGDTDATFAAAFLPAPQNAIRRHPRWRLRAAY